MKDLFLTNYTDLTFIDKVKDSLNKCESFSFSVSFIKKAGLVLLSKEIEEALKRGVKGKIITSTYQNFTDIASLETFVTWMETYPNFECHIDFKCFGENGYHSKGYIFQYKDAKEILVGSSNITRFALLKNIEWNLGFLSTKDSESISLMIEEFDKMWIQTLKLERNIIELYKQQLSFAIEKWDMDYFNVNENMVNPNQMQARALKELRRYRSLGVKKALVISATGSGKTYLAAFDARNEDAKRVLFVVHRDTILTAAKETFEKVFRNTRTYGVFTGAKQDLDADFIFASNVMLSRHLDDFAKNEFDYIVIDEAHHATTNSVRNILEYFDADFVLGLTATPERMDNQDVFALFDQNVPYELRLRDAILNDLVVPFHYYGIRDKFVDYSHKDKNRIAKEIASPDNISFISEEITKHKPNGKIKCLAFCSSIAHAITMAEAFNSYGYRALALTGDNDLGQRIKAFKALEDDNDPLEIICAVDILNEGVDIPSVNMVLFLRPTESSTIFLQQLGRGLRKYPNKEYVTVLDFIGNNYERSIQMAIALGTLSKSSYMEKAFLKELIKDDFKHLDIPGVIIDMDSLSKEEVIKHLNNTNFNKTDFLKKDYDNFKKYLKCTTYPSHMDYLECEYAPNLLRFIKASIKNKKNYSYYNFLVKIGEENTPSFTEKQISFLNKISELLPLVRKDEYLIIKQLLNEKLNTKSLINDRVSDVTLNHAIKMLVKSEILADDCGLNVDIMDEHFVNHLLDLIEYGLSRYDREFGDYEGEFALYRNYYKGQVMRVLLEDAEMFMKGTKFQDDSVYCFVGLKKDKEKVERTNYKDKFISPSIFQWESENYTTKTNSTGVKLLKANKVHLFVRKMDDEDGVTLPFTYFGTGKFTNPRDSYVDTKDKLGNDIKADTLLFDIKLDNEVPREYHFDFEIPSNEEEVN